MPTKIFKIRYNSRINLTEENVGLTLRRTFCDDFTVTELMKAPRVAMDLVKNKIDSVKYSIKRNRVLRKESKRK